MNESIRTTVTNSSWYDVPGVVGARKLTMPQHKQTRKYFIIVCCFLVKDEQWERTIG
jgi:hypothetical protein